VGAQTPAIDVDRRDAGRCRSERLSAGDARVRRGDIDGPALNWGVIHGNAYLARFLLASGRPSVYPPRLYCEGRPNSSDAIDRDTKQHG